MAKAPSFTLKDKVGKNHSLNDIDSDFVVIYFYPKDNTPGCTIEAIEFTEALKRFTKLRTSIVGISGGNEKSKTKFCEKHDLDVLLLSDPDFTIAKAYGAYGPKTFMGKKFNGIFRNTYVLDQKRNIVQVFENVKAAGHAEEVESYLRELSTSGTRAHPEA